MQGNIEKLIFKYIRFLDHSVQNELIIKQDGRLKFNITQRSGNERTNYFIFKI